MGKPTREYLTNRYMHHVLVGDQASRCERIRQQIFATAMICVELTPASLEQALALDALDHAMMLFNTAIARNEG